MARRPSQAARVRALIAKLESELRGTFERAIADLRDNIDYSALVEALEGRNLAGAIEALNIDEAAFNEYRSVWERLYSQAGEVEADGIKRATGAVGVRFNMADPAAAAWIRDQSSFRITAITDDLRDAVASAISEGFAEGRGPRDIARDIVGRSARGGRRQGGIIGLDGPRAERYGKITRGMETPEGVRSLIVKHRDGSIGMRYKVNPATASRIKRAYARGEAVPAADRAISARQLNNMLLKERGDTIARTETLQGVEAARSEAWKQGLRRLNAGPDEVEKIWQHGGGPKDPRPHHVAMNGQSVIGLDAEFEFDNGARMRFPGDPRAPASETVNCSCGVIYRLSVEARKRRAGV